MTCSLTKSREIGTGHISFFMFFHFSLISLVSDTFPTWGGGIHFNNLVRRIYRKGVIPAPFDILTFAISKQCWCNADSVGDWRTGHWILQWPVPTWTRPSTSRFLLMHIYLFIQTLQWTFLKHNLTVWNTIWHSLHRADIALWSSWHSLNTGFLITSFAWRESVAALKSCGAALTASLFVRR